MRRLAVVLCILVASCGATAPAEAKTLIRYERDGGLAGARDIVTVSTGGGVKVRRRTGTQRDKLSAGELRSLKRAIRVAGFPTLRTHYGPRIPISDGVEEAVRHGRYSVTIETGGQPPQRLRQLLERMAKML